MPERRFTVQHPVAGLEPGSTVTESDLAGCNVEALVEGGFLVPLDPPAPPPGVEQQPQP